MVHILLNINNFSDEFAFRNLKRFIKRKNNVLIIPLAYHEDYIRNNDDFLSKMSKESKDMSEIVNAFSKFKIPSKNIRILNCYGDSRETIENKFRRADILFFTGGYPDRLMSRIDEFNLRELILKHTGVIIGTSAGAMVQFDEFHVTPEEEGQEYYCMDGLGLLSGFDIEVHFCDAIVQVESVIRDLNNRGVPICIMPDHGGLVVNGAQKLPIGDAFFVDKNDIDVFQFVLEEAAINQRNTQSG